MNLPFSPTFFRKIDVFQQLTEYESEKNKKHLWEGQKAVLIWSASEHHQHLGSSIDSKHVKDALDYCVSEKIITEEAKKRLRGSAPHIVEALPTYGFGKLVDVSNPKNPRVRINRDGIQAGRILVETKYLKKTWWKYKIWIIVWWLILVAASIILVSQAASAVQDVFASGSNNQKSQGDYYENNQKESYGHYHSINKSDINSFYFEKHAKLDDLKKRSGTFHMNEWGENKAPQITSKTTPKFNESVWPPAIGAFLGAFFALVFGLVAFYFEKKFERYWKHKNAIVEIEHLLQDNLDLNSGNQFLLKGAIKTLKKNHMSYTLLSPLKLSEDINLRIGNLEALNRYFDYKEPVIKVNHSMKTWQGMNTQLQKVLISNPSLPSPVVHKNIDNIQEQAENLLKFIVALDQDTKYLLGYITAYIRKDKHIWSMWLYRMTNKEAPFISEKEIQIEIKALESEIKKITKKSKERIEKIINS